MRTEPEYDAVVVGAGVAGLTAARALVLQGRRVLVVDKQPVPGPVHKGELLQPRSLQILAALGALASLEERGASVARRLVCRDADGAEVGALDYRVLPAPWQHCLVHYYAEILAAIGSASGMEVLRGARVSGVLRDAGGRVTGVLLGDADGVRAVRAALVVGADGPSSVVRAATGAAGVRTRYGHDLAGFDLAGVPGLEADVSAYLTPAGLRLLVPMPGERARLYVQLPVGAYRELCRGDLPAWRERILAEVPALAPVAAALRAGPRAHVMPAWRYDAQQWTGPGLALVGDAAHSVHPMAGQGMNAAIADGWALAERLADVDLCDVGACDGALRSYEAERRPAMQYVSRLSHSLAVLFTDLGWRGQVVGRRMLRGGRDHTRLTSMLVTNVSGLEVQRFAARDRWAQVAAFARAGSVR